MELLQLRNEPHGYTHLVERLYSRGANEDSRIGASQKRCLQLAISAAGDKSWNDVIQQSKPLSNFALGIICKLHFATIEYILYTEDRNFENTRFFTGLQSRYVQE